MGFRGRFQRELRAAVRKATREGGPVNINRAGRVNVVVVRNTGGGGASASAHQTAPIVQQPDPAPRE
jgi:hypothetical protein